MAKNETSANIATDNAAPVGIQTSGVAALISFPDASKTPKKPLAASSNDVLVLELIHPSERVGKQKTIPAFLGKKRKYKMTATGIGVRIVSVASGRVMVVPWPNIVSAEMVDKEDAGA